jgi:hypothetical protein
MGNIGEWTESNNETKGPRVGGCLMFLEVKPWISRRGSRCAGIPVPSISDERIIGKWPSLMA